MKPLALALLACLALGACKTRVNADLYTADLVAASQGSTLTAPVTLGFAMRSWMECQQLGPSLITHVRRHAPEAQFLGCDMQNDASYARFRLRAEIIAFDTVLPTPDAPIAIGVKADAVGYVVAFLSNAEAAEAILAGLPDGIVPRDARPIAPVLTATLTNDLEGPVFITVDEVFADATPVTGIATKSLPRRGSIDLRLSDVSNAAFATTAVAAHIATFDPED